MNDFINILLIAGSSLILALLHREDKSVSLAVEWFAMTFIVVLFNGIVAVVLLGLSLLLSVRISSFSNFLIVVNAITVPSAWLFMKVKGW